MKTLSDLLWDLGNAGAKESNTYLRIRSIREQVDILELRYLQVTGEQPKEDVFDFELKHDVDNALSRIFAEVLLITQETDRDIYSIWDNFIEGISDPK